ncbi:MAG: hypothetical protein ACN6QT_04055 [Burkholderia contaminans]|uniref:Uncharacterized protein n=1 Tax=Burkholderia contaminans TaxID=488447 RepID=A0AAP4R1F0_9BURK|nr:MULTISPECIES: hypothetical protein [Burkholderia]MDN7565405.1 hypothetical protein [Burkholderia contaminans]MDN8022554.1 hypothetical protein [Burkholderia contaminans]UXZ69038.1 hypothetical protein NUJ29_25820 [Burkholderia contaminans]UXZ78403.1 hypothetical protein NUJ30_20220 [Burkholderia contaminans]
MSRSIGIWRIGMVPAPTGTRNRIHALPVDRPRGAGSTLPWNI